jgi:uncharacterized HAD superfamily protein
MRIAVDLDSTITATKTSIEFFKLLTAAFIKQNEIYNITNRQQGTELKIANELRMLNISYSHIVITSNKADYIRQKRIEVFFDDTDEYFLNVPESVLVFKIREAGNFDFCSKKWISSKRTVKLIDE